MLTSMREGIKSSKVLKFVLLLFICAPFAFFGVNSYFGNNGASSAVKVNGEEVPISMFDDELNMQRNRLKQAFGGSIPAGFASEDMLRQQALEGVITSAVLRSLADDQNLVVSDRSLALAITETEAFQVDGTFNQERYEAQLRSVGYSVGSFEAQFRGDVALQEFRDSIVNSSFVLTNEKLNAAKLNQQIRNAAYIEFKLDPLIETVELEENQLETYFEENKDGFKHPERVKIEYIELSSAGLKNAIEITEEETQEYFNSNSKNYRVAEERSASHILLALAKDASDGDVADKQKLSQEIKVRIDAGEAFSDLASEFSEDPGSAANGGSLGFFGKGAMVPAFEEAAFSMDVGSVSEPVRSDFGLHIIKLDDVKAESGQEFSAVKDEILDLLKQQKADEKFFDDNELLANKTYENPDSLIPASEDAGFVIKTSDWIDRLTSEGIGANKKIIAAALDPEVLNAGNNSPVIELDPSRVVVLRVLEHEIERQKTLEDVSDDLQKQLKRENAATILSSTVQKAVELFASEKELTAIAEELEGELVDFSDLTRGSTTVDRSILTSLFAMPKPASGKNSVKSLQLPNGNQVVISLAEVSTPEDNDEAESQPATLLDSNRIGSIEYEALVRGIRSRAVVDEINQQILQPVQQ